MSDMRRDDEPRGIGPRDDHMDDSEFGAEGGEMDALDRLITAAAQDYHRPPPAVPREAMWEAIMAARGGAAGTPDTADTAGVAAPALTLHTTRPAERRPAAAERAPVERRTRRLPSWLGLAIAAGLFLATGIGIGRWWGDTQVAGRGASQGPAERVAAADPRPGTPQPTDRQPGDTMSDGPLGDALGGPRDGAAAARPERGGEDAADRRPVPLEPRRSPRAFPGTYERVAVLPADASVEAGGPDATYEDATLRHFSAAEALLVSFRSGAGPALSDSLTLALDSRLSSWARQLLQDTRLLLDSPAGEDPRRRRLLEDLELVLAQITRLGAETARPSGSVAERDLIDGTIKRGQVLTRLRNAAPAGTE